MLFFKTSSPVASLAVFFYSNFLCSYLIRFLWSLISHFCHFDLFIWQYLLCQIVEQQKLVLNTKTWISIQQKKSIDTPQEPIDCKLLHLVNSRCLVRWYFLAGWPVCRFPGFPVQIALDQLCLNVSQCPSRIHQH